MANLTAKLIINVANPYYGNVEGAFSRVTVEKTLPYNPEYNIGNRVDLTLDVDGSNNPNQVYECEVRGKDIATDTNTGNTVFTYKLTSLN